MLWFTIYKRANNVAKCCKGQINFDALFHCLTSCPSLSISFRACKIDQIQLTSLDLLFTIDLNTCLNVYSENRMWSRWFSIHFRRRCFPITCSDIHGLLHFRNWLHNQPLQAFYKDSLLRSFMQFKLLWHCAFLVLSQQVIDFLIIDF